MRFAITDIHGHVDEAMAALGAVGLVDAQGQWCGDNAELWVLGDLLDRGPDGVGVVDLVRRLQAEAHGAGGRVECLLGNHEVLALGTHEFGDTEFGPADKRRNFANPWLRNGGVVTDQERLTPDRVAWLRERPALMCRDAYLALHSDIEAYRQWGRTVDEINTTVRAAVHSGDPWRVWELWEVLTGRYAFTGVEGHDAARQMLEALGGRRIVHGHTTVAHLSEPRRRSADVAEPLLYAGGLALGVDGGLDGGGPCLVVPLPPDGGFAS